MLCRRAAIRNSEKLGATNELKGKNENMIISGKARFNLTHCGRVTQICVFNTVKLGTSASSP